MVTLFLMTMSGVFMIIPKGVFIIMYVDDILLIVTGIHPRRRKLQTAVTVGPRSWKTRGPEVDIAMKSPLRMGANPMQVKALFIIDGSKAKRTVGVGVPGKLDTVCVVKAPYFPLMQQHCSKQLRDQVTS